MAATRKKTSNSRKSQRAQAGRGTRLGIAIATFGLAAAGAGLALLARRLLMPGNAEHEAPDLALDQPHSGPYDRAPIAFRPDPTAPVPAS